MIIGLTGLAGSGKSTAAEYLVREHGFIRQGFAWPLKKMLRTLDPIIGSVTIEHAEEAWDGRNWRPSHFEKQEVSLAQASGALGYTELEIKAEFPEYRRLLQVLGTDCIRAVDPDFWVKAAMKDLDPEKDYVFDDVRFPNEASAIQDDVFGALIHVDRPGLVRGDHPSEQHAGLMYEDAGVMNVGGIGDLHSQLDRVLSRFKVLA